jgi:hypothetical protein
MINPSCYAKAAFPAEKSRPDFPDRMSEPIPVKKKRED